MAIGRTNVGGSGGSGGTLTVTAPVGVTVTVSKDGKTKTKTADSSGMAVFKGLDTGTWTVTITDGVQTATQSVGINTDYDALMSFNAIPSFTYTGDYEIVNDNNEPIAVSQDNWKIRFLTSGTLTFTQLNGASNGVDVFLVGGGGGSGGTANNQVSTGGGGGGYTVTQKAIQVNIGTSYAIVIGAGGPVATTGGETSAFSLSAAGGGASIYNSATGGSGGSGGGAGGAWKTDGGAGGSDGSDGSNSGAGSGGTGQGSTTREFGDPSGKLYAGGGGGGTFSATIGAGGSGGGADGTNGSNVHSAISAAANTGGGAGGAGSWNGGGSSGASGGSGIVVIRNKR